MGLKMMQLRQDKSKSSFDIWNDCQVFLGKNLALAVGDLYYFENMMSISGDLNYLIIILSFVLFGGVSICYRAFWDFFALFFHQH